MTEKILNEWFKLKTYWKKPPRGYDVSYKEFLNLALGFGGISFMSVIIQWTTLSMSVHMMISYFKVSTGLVWLLGIAGSFFALIRSPIQSMLLDNSNSAKGKFKPFLLWTSIGTVVCFMLIPFVPSAWNDLTLFGFGLPAIPIMGVNEASTITVSLGVLIMFALIQVGAFFQTVLNQAMAGIEQTISRVAQERANIGSIKGLICNLPSSIVNIILPILAGSLFAQKGGWNSIEMYRWIFPFCAVGSLICIMFTVKGTKERVIVNQKYVAKVRFWEGAKELSKNKYFWIITGLNIAVGLRNYSNITTWITQYSFVSDAAKTIVGIYCTTILMTVLVIGMVTGPFVIKKWGKRNVLLYSAAGMALMIFAQLMFYKKPVMILLSMLLQNIFSGYAFIAGIMVSDVLDYQQWKTGKRLEGFWQNYNAFISTIVGVFMGMLLPLFLSMGGIGFGDNLSEALQNAELRNGAYKYQSLLALIGSIICIIPLFFYDLTEKKHANYVRALKIRAAADNYKDGCLTDENVLSVYEIVGYAAEKDDAFIKDELSKFDCIEEILKDYEEVKARVAAAERKENLESFIRNVELEGKRVAQRTQKAKQKAEKAKKDFDEKAYADTQKLHSQFLRYFVSGELASYGTAENIIANAETAYTELEALWESQRAAKEAEKLAKLEEKKRQS